MKKIILAALAIAALFSCAKQPELPDPVTGARRVKIGANLPKETKVALEEYGRHLKTTWEAGDPISVIYYSSTEGKYVNELFVLDTGAGTASGTFVNPSSLLPDGEPFKVCYPYFPEEDGNAWTMLLGSQEGTLDGMGELIPLSADAADLSVSPVLEPIINILRLKAGLKLITHDDATNVPIRFTVNGQALYASAAYDESSLTLTGNKAPISLNGALTMSNGVLNQDVYVILHLTEGGRTNTSLDLRLLRGTSPNIDTYNWTLSRTGTMVKGQMYSLSPDGTGAHPDLPAQQLKTYIPEPFNELYIATDGNDSYPGTISQPLATLQRAFTFAVPGTHIYFRGSTDPKNPTVYTIDKAWLENKSGTPDHPIVIGTLPYKDGQYDRYENVVLDASNMTHNAGNDDAYIGLLNASWVRINNLNIRNSKMTGIGIVRGSSHVTVEDCHIENCQGPGIGVGYLGHESVDIRIHDNMVVNCAQVQKEAISLRKVNGFQVYNNHVQDVIKESIDAKGGCRNGSIYHNQIENAGHVGIYVDAGFPVEPSYTETPGQTVPPTRNILIYGNRIVYGGLSEGSTAPFGQGTGITVASEEGNDVSDIYIYNNLVFNASAFPASSEVQSCGIKVATNGGVTTGTLKDIFIYNNTVYNMTQQGVYVNFPTIQNIVIRNNILVKNQAGDIQVKDGIDASEVIRQNNLFCEMTSATYPYRGEPYFDESSLANLFVRDWAADWKDIDLHIRAGSLAIGNGTILTAPHDDFDEKQRNPYSVDIGAYKYE